MNNFVNSQTKSHHDLIVSASLMLAIAVLLSYVYETTSETGKYVAIYISITMAVYYMFRDRYRKTKFDKSVFYKAMMFAVIGVVAVSNTRLA